MYRLALQLGVWDVDRLAEQMPYSALCKWEDYARIEPFGNPWDNWLMAVPATMFSQVHSKKGATPKMTDFMYEDAETKKQREAEQLMHFFDTFEPKK